MTSPLSPRIDMWNLLPNERVKNNTWGWVDAFTPEECATIIEYGKKQSFSDGVVRAENEFDPTIRKSKIAWLFVNESTDWLYKKCTDIVTYMNAEVFQFDLDYIESLQFAIYDSSDSGFYGKHIDGNYYEHPNHMRKLSFAVQLSSPSDYEGGELAFHVGSDVTKMDKVLGRAVFFPSYVTHEVLPVTSGTRYSLVGWVRGKKFR